MHEEHLHREVSFCLHDLISDIVGCSSQELFTILVNDEPAIGEDTSIDDFIQGKPTNSLWSTLAAYDNTVANISRNTISQRRCRERKRKRQIAAAARSCSKITDYFKLVHLETSSLSESADLGYSDIEVRKY